MNELATFCKQLKKDFTPTIQDPSRPVRYWSEKDRLDGRVVDAYVVVLRTRGCTWALNSGCTMCGYFNDSLWKNVSDKELVQQFDTAMNQYTGEKLVKLFTSGSFLDDNELSSAVRNKILSKLVEKTEKISVETRPEYVTKDRLAEIADIVQLKTFEISIGLETANDLVRDHAINKGFTFNEYKQAVETVKKHGFKLKTYVLMKPPFLTEKEAIDDSINTVDKIKDYSDTISFNPTTVQRNTVVDYLWKRNQYRPPWLWSVIEVLQASKKMAKNSRIQCDIAGGGSPRGAHNCKACNQQILREIESFSLSQDTKVSKNLTCDCKGKWYDQLDIESLGFGSLVDLSRGYA